ncbi:MAG TPA: ABC transporter ATP-binding protein, partial [Bacteroidia bacterium]|nr:ABC transporter ATP-binding protein [Bacteroidia bacterium]
MNNFPKNISGIQLHNVGKKFRDQWIFRKIDFHIAKGEKVAINGHNGSGKSTLLQIISGYVSASEGKVDWLSGDTALLPEQVYKHIALASPYLDLIDEFTLEENIDFFTRLKPVKQGFSSNDLLKLTGLENAAGRQFRYFSSGMKQKVKLTLAFLADVDILLLDEPLSNLDQAGYSWYQEIFNNYGKDKTIIVCSNMVKE